MKMRRQLSRPDFVKKTQIAGVPVDNLNYNEILWRIGEAVAAKRKIHIVTVNPEMVLNAERDKNFFAILKKSKINTPDGIGILWAAYYLSKNYKSRISRFLWLFWSLVAIFLRPSKIRSVINERVTGTDLLERIVCASQKTGWRLFLLGAEEGVAAAAKEKFLSLYPRAAFAGVFAGSPAAKDEPEICSLIERAKPDILFVAYGSPEQELWISRNFFKLDSAKAAIGVGGAFDFFAGKVRRAPKFMRSIGLEWLWRLTRQPKRFSRIWNATFRFVRLIVTRGKW